MILQRLARLLDSADEHVLYRYLWLTLIYCIIQGGAFALVLPVMQALLAGEPARAVGWLVPLALATAVIWWLSYRSTLGGFEVAIRLLETLRHRVGLHVVTLPLGWFTPAQIGHLSVVLSQGVMEMLGLPARQLTPLLRATVTPMVLVAIMAFFDWRVALAAAVTFPCVAVAYWWAGRLGRAADRAVHAAAAEASERMVEFAQCQPVLRAYSGQRGLDLFDAALRKQSHAHRRQIWMVIPPLLANSWIAQLSFLMLMALVTWLALDGGNPRHLVTLIAMLALINRIVDPLTEVASYSAGIRMASTQVDALGAILAAAPLPVADPAAPQLRGGDVELDRVSFAYGPDAPVLADVSFHVPANTTTALLGVSGSGKTTIMQLVARFHDPDSGAVRIGGTDIRAVKAGDLMRFIAPVFQDTYLFSGSLRDNVLLGDPAAGEGDLRDAAALAQLDEVVARLPEGWDSQVGERGSLLSGGERQRVCIARAVLKRAPILLLDEISSALDAETQAAVARGLRALNGRATLLVITHDLSTIRDADQIVVLDRGRIVERGTHPQLMAVGGRYAAFWCARSASGGWRLAPSRPTPSLDRIPDGQLIP